MRKATYRVGDKEEIILANCISKLEYEKKYKGNLKCNIKGCNAKLGFREIKKNKDRKYFYTLPNTKHSEGCPNKVEKKRRKFNRHLKFKIKPLEKNKGDLESEQLIFDI